MVKLVENKAEFDQIIKEAGSKAVFIDFTASWCGPCKMIGPVFEKLAQENDTVIFIKVDVDEAEDVAAACGISAMPTFHVYKDGTKVDDMTGANESKLKELVSKYK